MTVTTRDEPDPERLEIVDLERRVRGPSFAEDVAAGLSSDPKWLSPKYFYDELGSRLFEAICALPEYQVARIEGEILARHADQIVAELAEPVLLVELGSGSSVKTRHVIDALLERQGCLEYRPIDISRTALEESCERLLGEHDDLAIRAYAGDYRDAFEAFAPRDSEGPGSALVLFLGSTIGNMDPAEAEALLRIVRGWLRPGDALLLGTDLVKPTELMIPAYDDALGVTAAFNLNLLVRINRELGGRFEVRSFSHRAIWNAEESRIEMHIVSERNQRVAIEALGSEVELARGEPIVSEVSYKFDDRRIDRLAERSGFVASRRWSDDAGHFGSNLFVAG